MSVLSIFVNRIANNRFPLIMCNVAYRIPSCNELAQIDLNRNVEIFHWIDWKSTGNNYNRTNVFWSQFAVVISTNKLKAREKKWRIAIITMNTVNCITISLQSTEQVQFKWFFHWSSIVLLQQNITYHYHKAMHSMPNSNNVHRQNDRPVTIYWNQYNLDHLKLGITLVSHWRSIGPQLRAETASIPPSIMQDINKTKQSKTKRKKKWNRPFNTIEFSTSKSSWHFSTLIQYADKTCFDTLFSLSLDASTSHFSTQIQRERHIIHRAWSIIGSLVNWRPCRFMCIRPRISRPDETQNDDV